MTRQLKFNEAILEATDQLLESDPRVYLMGLGVPDPKGIFGTTINLHKKYGSHRVMDMPTSENAMTGVAIGSAINGMRPIMTHQRVDFFLLALDQLINNAAKWFYMFGGKMHVPFVIRLIIGRGWGQGPQHSQSFQSLFAHIPGLKVVAPSTPLDAKGLLISCVEDGNPCVFLEHRWLHNIYGDVPKEMIRIPIGKAKIVKEGKDLTIVCSSHMTLEAWKASSMLTNEGIDAEIIDLRTINPIDKETILNSIKKTGRLVVLDGDWKTAGLAAEIIAIVAEESLSFLKAAPIRITHPDRHCPTSWLLSNHFYPTSTDIAIRIIQFLDRKIRSKGLVENLIKQKMEIPLDVPDRSFTGPF
jgi:pyruvate/2-oxoglutarate/acetoin dehydrogenase E1 component